VIKRERAHCTNVQSTYFTAVDEGREREREREDQSNCLRRRNWKKEREREREREREFNPSVLATRALCSAIQYGVREQLGPAADEREAVE
jgi:hypothetical protein